jgi:hypothetical protein
LPLTNLPNFANVTRSKSEFRPFALVVLVAMHKIFLAAAAATNLSLFLCLSASLRYAFIFSFFTDTEVSIAA